MRLDHLLSKEKDGQESKVGLLLFNYESLIVGKARRGMIRKIFGKSEDQSEL